MVVDVQLFEGKNLDTVSQVETLASYGASIIENYAAYTSASAMVETAEKLTGDVSTPQQYLLLLGGLRSLANADHDPSLILDSYLLRALSVAGWAPNFADCSRCNAAGPHRAFVLQLGGVVCPDCKPAGAAVIDDETANLLGALLSGEWDVADSSSQRSRTAAAGIVAAYSQWHIERGLKSLQHVERE